MRIRTRLKFAVFVPLIMALVIGVTLFYSYRVMEKATANGDQVRQIRRSLSELHPLIYSYISYREERPKQQFLAECNSLMGLIENIDLSDPDQRRLLVDIRLNSQIMKDHFLRLVSKNDPFGREGSNDFPKEEEERMVGQLLTRVQRADSSASSLRRMVDDEIRGNYKNAFLLIMLVLVLSVAPLTVGLARTRGKINASLVTLHHGTEAVGAGNLDSPITGMPNDELGDLSRAFNQMSANLKAVTASRADLRMEMAEREKAQIALRESEQRWATTLASISDAVIATDMTGRITFMNGIAETLTGWTLSGASMKPVAEVFKIVNEQTRQKAENPVHKVLERGNIVGLANHTVLVRKDGTEVAIDDSGAPIRDKDGKITGVVLVFRDITERRKIEQTLRESEAKANAMIRYAPTGIYEIDYRGPRFISVNDAMCHILGYTREELFSIGPGALLDENGRKLFADRIRRQLAGEKIEESMEYRVRKKDGSFIDSILNLSFNPGGDDPYRALVIAHDITERKRAEETTRLSEEKFAKTFAMNPTAIAVTRLMDGLILEANETWLATFGYNRDEVNGQSTLSLRIWPTPESRARYAEEVREKGSLRGWEQTLRKRSGEPIVLLGSAEKLTIAGEEVFLSTWLDITERKRAEEELRKAHDELELRVRERTEELAKSQQRLQQLAAQLLLAQEKERKRVAVELHDGLLSELAATKFLLEGKLSLLEKGKISDLGELRKVGDVLGIAMKEARRIMNNLHPSVLEELGLIVAMNWLCGEYQRSYPHIAVQKQIEVSEQDISESARVVIYRVLQEALNNIAKHARGDRVDLSLSKSDSTFALTIQDNGQGFDVENVQKGLGLESMRERVELSGGEFQIESGIGQGTTIRASWRL